MSQQDGPALIKESLRIDEFIGRYVQLKRRGHRLVACCPFHNEKTPSFNVDPDKGFYHCFGCGAGGDLIKFAMEIEGLEFVEALDYLADIAGVELPKRRGRGPSRDTVAQLRTLNEEAMQFYNQQLRRNKTALDYLEKRGVRESTANLFRLGFSLNQWDGLLNHVRGKFPPEILQQSGLFKEGKTGKPYDLFRDRVIFPIQDTYGHVVAFGGRSIDPEIQPKYINSPETPIYTKGKHLYNLNLAKNVVKKSKRVIVVEGYMDAIQVSQAGVGDIIASLGTAFTPAQAKLLKRHAETVVLNFDGDAAGFKAARVSIETCLAQNLSIKVISLPDNQDPDDFIREHGVQAYREHLEEASGFYDFLMKYLSNEYDRQDPRQLSQITREMCGALGHIDDAVQRAFYLEKLSDDLGVSPQVLNQVSREATPSQQSQTQTLSPRTPQPAPPQPVRHFRRKQLFNKIEQEFIYHATHHPHFEEAMSQEHRTNIPAIIQSIFSDRPWVLSFLKHQDPDTERRMTEVPEEFRGSLREIFFDDAYQTDDTTRLEVLFPDLLSAMLKKLVDENRLKMRGLTDFEKERKLAIVAQNTEYKRQIQLLKISTQT